MLLLVAEDGLYACQGLLSTVAVGVSQQLTMFLSDAIGVDQPSMTAPACSLGLATTM